MFKLFSVFLFESEILLESSKLSTKDDIHNAVASFDDLPKSKQASVAKAILSVADKLNYVVKKEEILKFKSPEKLKPTLQKLNIRELDNNFFEKIDNRRFMILKNKLVLGGNNISVSSHAEEWKKSGELATEFDSAVRGWVDGGDQNQRFYKHGIIHFSPPITKENFSEGFDVIKSMMKLGASDKTVIRNFMGIKETTISDILSN